MMKNILILAVLNFYFVTINAQTAKDASVELKAITQSNPDKIKLTWLKNDLAISYVIYRKQKTANS
ncbi:MAG: hypothetical protein IPO92_01955 [Saprospiraceae bacterium]|nr:hypothetical protein [Saprospiraceae bacterium]